MKNNIQVNDKENYIIVTVNSKIYPLDVVYSAAYVFIDKAYVLIDGDPEKEISVQMKPKGSADLETLGKEFNNELLHYSVYKTQAERNAPIRNAIIQRALLTNVTQGNEKMTEVPEGIIEPWKDSETYIDDPEGIAIPWKEKYGNGPQEAGVSKPEDNAECNDVVVHWEDLEKDDMPDWKAMILDFIISAEFPGRHDSPVIQNLLDMGYTRFFFELGDECAFHVMCDPAYELNAGNRKYYCDSIVFSDNRNKLFIQNRETYANQRHMKKITHFGVAIDNTEKLFHKEIERLGNPSSFFFTKQNNEYISREELDSILKHGPEAMAMDNEMRLQWISVKNDRDVFSFYYYSEFGDSAQAARFLEKKHDEGFITNNLDEVKMFMGQFINHFGLKKINMYIRKDYPIHKEASQKGKSGIYFLLKI